MGEIVVTVAGEELVALGLGSCIALAIVDWSAGVAGLAHVVLPDSGGRTEERGKFADTAVPELLRSLDQAGAAPRRLEAAIAGGARMFETSGGLDIGARNEQAVRAALATERISVRAAQTGGSQGRTVRIAIAERKVTVRVAGEEPEMLLAAGIGLGRGDSPLGASVLTLHNLARMGRPRPSMAGASLGGGGRL
ncbi:MAG: chemotaxis protein CheD [Solirubrobacteraceae bacterium]